MTWSHLAGLVGRREQATRKLKILYCGARRGNGLSRLRALRALGHEVQAVEPNAASRRAPRLIRSLEWRLKNGLLTWVSNRTILRKGRSLNPDLVWIEGGICVYAGVWRRIKDETNACLVNLMSDDFLDTTTRKRSRHYEAAIPLFGVIFTPRDANYGELYARGAQRAEKFWKGYDEVVVRPIKLTAEEKRRFGCDVVFAGHLEPPRVEGLAALVRTGARVNGWYGRRWRCAWPKDLAFPYRGRAEGEEYAKALCGAKIALNFLSRWARDTQNSRAFEIPATGTFMLSEQSGDLMASFTEGKEAEFFSSTEEMLDKVRFYLGHERSRKQIAARGRERCIRSGYSNRARVREMMVTIDRSMYASRKTVD